MYSSARQDDWAELLPLAEYAYNNAENSSTKASPFLLLYGYHPSPDGEPVDNKKWNTGQLIAEARRILELARGEMARYANRKRRVAPFKVGDQVYLSSKHLGIVQASAKLGPKFVGPYPVLESFNDTSYRLDTPGLRKHNVYHASLLKPAFGDRRPPKPPPVLVDEEEEYEIEAILAKRSHKKDATKDSFRVRWKGYGAEHDAWYPRKHLEHAEELVAEFEARASA